MKKTYSFLFAAVALFAAASCQDELISTETPAVQGERFTVTAAADAQTKTALTDEGLNSVWTPGDAIAVIDFMGKGAEFTTDITENAASAKFTCENFNTGGLTDISALPIVALYPYQDGLTCSIQSQLNQTGDNTIKGITFPHEQTAVVGSFDKSAAFTWAMATGATKDNLVFNNLYSLLKVKVTEENITSITVSATSGSLAGNVTLPITQSGAELTVVDGQGQSSVTLTCEDGFDTEKYYYICVLPGTYEGFSIALNGYTVKTKASAATFAAATVYDLGAVERKPAPFSMIGSHNSWSFANLTPMYEKDGYYVAENITFVGSDCKFKFIASNASNWGASNYGSGANVKSGNAYRIWSGGGDNSVTAGTYDIYFSINKMFWFIVDANSEIADETIKLVSDKYGLVGNLKDNEWGSAVPFYIKGKYLVAKSLTFSASPAQFKIRQNDDWSGEAFGMSGSTPCGLNTEIKLNGGNNVEVTLSDISKEYDAYTDLVTIKVVEKGTIVK